MAAQPSTRAAPQTPPRERRAPRAQHNGANGHQPPINLDLLKQLTETPGVAGREERIRQLVITELRPLVDEIHTDTLGNVIALKRGKGQRRVMLAAHMDEIGFMVRYIDERGFLSPQPLGGFDPRVLVAQRVVVHTRDGQALHGVLTPTTKPVHMLLPKEKPEVPKLDDFYIDLGLPADQVHALVSLGDSITMDRTLECVGENVIAKAMDDRTGVFTMIEALRRLGRHAVDIYAVATVQEEVGLRGATTAAHAIEPEVAIALDTTLAMDTPGLPENGAVTRLGEGVAIKVFDASFIPNHKLVQHLRTIAERAGIRHQLEVLPRGGTDAGAMQRAGTGAAAITLSIPSRYVHTVNEMVNTGDLDAAATLLARYLEDAHTGAYEL